MKSVLLTIIKVIFLVGSIFIYQACKKDKVLLSNEVPISTHAYYVSPDGNDGNPGTIIEPWATWQKAFTGRVAGDTVYFRGGTWSPTSESVTCSSVYINGLTGTHDHPICFFAYPPDFAVGNRPVLDLINLSSNCYTVAGLEMENSTYLKFKGLTVKNRKQNSTTRVVYAILAGNDISPNGNLYFDQVTSYGHGGPGFFINYYDTLYLINCDSHNNCDSLDMGGLLGGFGNGYSISAKGNPADLYRYTFISGCRAWKNSADGFAVSTTKQCYVINNWAFEGGQLNGDGDGFKFMFSYETDPSKRMICNNIAASCIHESFSENNLTDVTYGPFASYYNNTVYNCEFGFSSYPEDWNGVLGSVIYKNNLVYMSHGDPTFEQTKLLAHQYNFPSYCTFSNNTWIPNVNYPFWAYNPAVTVIDDDFLSLDVTELERPRKADGSLPDVNFLRLAPGSDLIDAGVNVGLPYQGSFPDIGCFEF
jgi:hypothetical protein